MNNLYAIITFDEYNDEIIDIDMTFDLETAKADVQYEERINHTCYKLDGAMYRTMLYRLPAEVTPEEFNKRPGYYIDYAEDCFCYGELLDVA